MRNRLSAITAAVTTALLVTGISWAASDGVSATNETESNVAIDVNHDLEIPVEDAGTVRLGSDGTTLTILAAVAAEGFVVEVEVPEGREVEADFRGEGRRLQFNAELEDGVVRVRIRTEVSAEASTETSTSVTVEDSSTTSTAPESTTSTSTTATTIDDDDEGDDEGQDEGSSIVLPVGPVVYDVSGAATVTVVFSLTGHIELSTVSPASGWTIEETKQENDEVEVRLVRGDEEEARFRLRIEDGRVRVEVELED